MIRKTWMLLAMLCLTGVVGAAEPLTEHTYKLGEGETRPKATLEDASWLAGMWTGTGFGQRIEETWTAPSAGSMVGSFKLFGDDGISFYEIMLITVDEGTLSLKVKHFSEKFHAWEEKEDFVNFRLVKVEENALHFGGLSFYRNGDDCIDGYIVMRNGDELAEHHLAYQRYKPDK